MWIRIQVLSKRIGVMAEGADYIECEQCGELVPNEDIFIDSDIFQSSTTGKWFCKSCYKNGIYDHGDE